MTMCGPGMNPSMTPVSAGLEKISSAAKQLDRCNQRDHESLNVTEALGLEIKHRQHIQRSDDAPPYQRNPEKKLQANGRPDNFGQIACGNGDFAKNPEKPYGWG